MFSYPTPRDAASAGYAMVADRFALLIGADAEGDLARRLWQVLTDADTVFEDVLSVIAAVGIGRLPDFALVELVDVATSSVSVAVRGAAGVDLHGPQRSTYSGGGVGTWVEGSAQHVAGIALSLPGRDDDEVLPLGRGVARATGLRWGAPVQDAVPAVSAEPERAPEPERSSKTEQSAAFESTPASALADIDPLETVAIDRAALAAAVPGPRRTGRPAAPPLPPAGDAAAAGRPAAENEPGADTDDPGGPDGPDDLDERTMLGKRRSAAVAAAPPPAAHFVLRVEPGGELPLDRPIVLGRSPKASAHPGARIAAVPSPRKEVSGTHLEVRLEGSELVVRDLDSTNGTVVRTPDDEVGLLRGGASLSVPVDTVLDLGDGVVATFATTL